MPKLMASDPDMLGSTPLAIISAITTPTAIPSGKLCIVTANANICDRERCDFGPSGVAESICWWGVNVSTASRNAIPSAKPTAAGTTRQAPSPLISMLGMSNDHTPAAIMTPEAKPNKAFSVSRGISPRIKNTKADPSVVPSTGISNAMNVYMMRLSKSLPRI